MGEREFLAVHPDPVIQYAKGEGGVGVRRVNEAFESTFGDDGSSVALDDTIASDDDLDTVAEAVVAGDPLDSTVACATVDGRRRFRVRNVPDGDGGYLVYTDVSEYADRIDELEADNEQLEAFASVVSHDLRNPISIAERYLDRAREDGDPEDFERVADSLSRMRTLIDDVLALARVGEAIDETERVTLESVVEPAWETVETGAASLELADGSMTLKTDPSRLRQSVENLFRNALEHGGSDVTVRVGTIEDGFYVEDDGPGIPESERDEVFEPGVTSSTEGTGLGLAIVERVVEAHGWTITATEASDGGAAEEGTESAARQRGSAGGARFEITGVDSLQPF